MKFKFEIVQENVVEEPILVELKGFCFFVGWFRYLYDFKKFTIYFKRWNAKKVSAIEVMRGKKFSPKNKIKKMMRWVPMGRCNIWRKISDWRTIARKWYQFRKKERFRELIYKTSGTAHINKQQLNYKHFLSNLVLNLAFLWKTSSILFN